MYNFLLRMTHTITSQNIELSSWNTLGYTIEYVDDSELRMGRRWKKRSCVTIPVFTKDIQEIYEIHKSATTKSIYQKTQQRREPQSFHRQYLNIYDINFLDHYDCITDYTKILSNCKASSFYC
jgi:hypothetical protein